MCNTKRGFKINYCLKNIHGVDPTSPFNRTIPHRNAHSFLAYAG